MFPSVFMASVNEKQCKVLDIQFHAFQIPTFFSTLYTSLKTWQVQDCWVGIRKKESAFKKCREVRQRRSKTVQIWNVDRNRENLWKEHANPLDLRVGYVVFVSFIHVKFPLIFLLTDEVTRDLLYQKSLQ